MKTVTIHVPDDCEVQVVEKKKCKFKKEDEMSPIIKTYQDLYDCNSDIPPLDNNWAVQSLCESTKVTEKVAKSMLAMAMISQLMPYYGGAITDKEWRDSIEKSFISKFDGKLSFGITVFNYEYLAFHTQGQRDEFLKYNEQLVKDYLMVD